MNLSDTVSPMIQKAMKEHRITGASVSIIVGDEPPAVINHGFADKKMKRQVDGSTLNAGYY